jgi:lipopolysaccharide biosynthesis regulator YciM
LYAEAGLLDEAEQEFRALEKANPTSPIARRLLTNVRALQR